MDRDLLLAVLGVIGVAVLVLAAVLERMNQRK